MTTSIDRRPVVLRGSLFFRLMGGWLWFIALFGLVSVAIRSGPAAELLAGLFWAAPAGWWGWRLARLGVSAEADEVVVRNPLRTYRIRYDDIVDVRLHLRSSSQPIARAMLAVWNRAAGVLDVPGRDAAVEMYSTESFVPMGRLGTRSADDVATIRSLWLERRRNPS